MKYLCRPHRGAAEIRNASFLQVRCDWVLSEEPNCRAKLLPFSLVCLELFPSYLEDDGRCLSLMLKAKCVAKSRSLFLSWKLSERETFDCLINRIRKEKKNLSTWGYRE